MFTCIMRLMCKVVVVVKNFLLDNLIAFSHDMVFGKLCTW